MGTHAHAIGRRQTTEVLSGFLRDRKPRHIVTINVDFLHQANSSPAFKQLLNGADLALLDGKPLVWAARYLGFSHSERVTGPDLIDACAELSSTEGHRIFFLGGADGVAAEAKTLIEQRYPGVVICGAYSPPPADYPLPREIDDEIVMRIRDAQPDILFVAFGCPKQELWIRDHADQLGVTIAAGIGGSFNFITGSTPRAPRLMQNMGLEWVYRLYLEPKRLWRRYLCADLPLVLKLAALEALGRIPLFRRSVIEVVSY
jgi:N-acetylglucosaminyldiphosphoundecaprenol N-acetyl-beta-D-mannosaminyltransferase